MPESLKIKGKMGKRNQKVEERAGKSYFWGMRKRKLINKRDRMMTKRLTNTGEYR